MVDKSLPFCNICMQMPAEKLLSLSQPPLAENHSFSEYRPGNMEDWARIETSVLEFPYEKDALAYFEKEFLPFSEQLKDRMCFVLDPSGRPVATATAWYRNVQGEVRNMLHWVAVCPTNQTIGLGKAVIVRALRRFTELGQAGDVFLHTQTWSHKAVSLYHSLGFVIRRTDVLSGKTMPYEKALEVLSWRLPEDTMRSLADTLE